jgi:lipoate-protein ligase A
MQSLGIEVTSNNRNSLFAGNLKFSGHAEHIFHDKVLHHGTLLFNSDLKVLQHCLVPAREYQGKALASVRSEVGNLAPLLPENMNIHQFINHIVTWLTRFFPDSHSYTLSGKEIDEIRDLEVKKYRTWQWNFGYSPVYSFEIELPLSGGNLVSQVKVENGIISQIDTHNFPDNEGIMHTLSGLKGIAHNEEAIINFADNNRDKFEPEGINTVTLIKTFFK